MTKYNTTELHPEIEFEQHIFSRDRFAHYLRWSYVLNIANIGMKILDFGCGSGNLLEVLYRNRYKGKYYLGLDIRQKTIESNREKFKNVNWAHFEVEDLVNMSKDYNDDFGSDWDLITSFEVVEHIGHENIDKFLQNILKHCNDKTKVLISTPNYDEKVGAADNHIIEGKVGEWKHEELQKKLEEYFIIEKKFGTFASIKDYKHLLNDWQLKMFDSLKEYYDSNLISVIMAPFFPEQSRNTLWVLHKK